MKELTAFEKAQVAEAFTSPGGRIFIRMMTEKAQASADACVSFATTEKDLAMHRGIVAAWRKILSFLSPLGLIDSERSDVHG